MMSSVRSIFIALVVATAPTAGITQPLEKFRGIVEVDPDAPAKYDTAYVTHYRDNLTVSLVSTYRSVNVDLANADDYTLSYSTNNAEQYGFGFSLKWLSVEATFGVPIFSKPEPGKGSTDSRGIGLGFTGRRIWGRVFYNSTHGFYAEDPQQIDPDWIEGDDWPVRSDLKNNTLLASATYALSKKKRFSQNAAQFQVERQKRSAGTFVAGIGVWVSNISADSSLVPIALLDTFGIDARFKGVHRTVIGGTIGYAHTFVLFHKAFIHLAVLPGVASSHYRVTPEDDGEDIKGTQAGALTEVKFGAGYNGDRWYASLTSAVYVSSADVADNVSLDATYVFVRAAIGMRFRSPQWGVLEKVGL